MVRTHLFNWLVWDRTGKCKCVHPKLNYTWLFNVLIKGGHSRLDCPIQRLFETRFRWDLLVFPLLCWVCLFTTACSIGPTVSGFVFMKGCGLETKPHCLIISLLRMRQLLCRWWFMHGTKCRETVMKGAFATGITWIMASFHGLIIFDGDLVWIRNKSALPLWSAHPWSRNNWSGRRLVKLIIVQKATVAFLDIRRCDNHRWQPAVGTLYLLLIDCLGAGLQGLWAVTAETRDPRSICG